MNEMRKLMEAVEQIDEEGQKPRLKKHTVYSVTLPGGWGEDTYYHSKKEAAIAFAEMYAEEHVENDANDWNREYKKGLQIAKQILNKPMDTR